MVHEEREGFAVWITGLPASGKSAVTAALLTSLRQRGVRVEVLESDVLRRQFSANPRYDDLEREYFYGSIVLIGRVLTENGIAVIFDATANRRVWRERARQQIPHFLEIYVDCPLEVCMQRDPKGIYRRGRAGEAQHVPGLQAEYEPPENPDVIIRGDRDTPEYGAAQILKILEARGMLR